LPLIVLAAYNFNAMTVKELRDALDNYIKKDPPDLWQLNDSDADAAAYKERCEERENREVIILDDGMQPKYFSIDSAFGTSMPKQLEADSAHYIMKEIFALCTDLINEVL
jgi:hypothetical protein